jgi:hypothetical protein
VRLLDATNILLLAREAELMSIPRARKYPSLEREAERMQVGDPVIVKGSGQHALIIAELPHHRFQVQYLPSPGEDPVDRDSPVTDDEGGIYEEADLQPIPR